MAFAARRYGLDSFAMTAGMVVSVDREQFDKLSTALLNLLALQHTQPPRLADDRRFTAAIYRDAIDQDAMDQVVSQ